MVSLTGSPIIYVMYISSAQIQVKNAQRDNRWRCTGPYRGDRQSLRQMIEPMNLGVSRQQLRTGQLNFL
jgi:hypothetical protein